MASFTITSTTSLDGVLLRSNSRTVEARSVMDYTKTLGATYDAIVTGDDQPTPFAQVLLKNTGDETALVRCSVDGTNFYFTALPSGATMSCPLKNLSGNFQQYAARAETGTTTLRIVALYI
jgi:hypothetical protein